MKKDAHQLAGTGWKLYIFTDIFTVYFCWSTGYMKQFFPSVFLFLCTVFLRPAASGQSIDASSNELLLFTVFIDSLHTGSVYELHINSKGCYTSDTLLINIKKENTGYFVRATHSSTSIHSDGVIDKKHYEARIISPGQLNSLRKLEKDLAAEVSFLYVAGTEHIYVECRYITEYTIGLEGKMKNFMDEFCRINKLKELLQMFFPEVDE